jgi:hypothetical protein
LLSLGVQLATPEEDLHGKGQKQGDLVQPVWRSQGKDPHQNRGKYSSNYFISDESSLCLKSKLYGAILLLTVFLPFV